jgi:lipase
MSTLNVHVWGDETAPRIVCLHGITGWGGHFGELARRQLTSTHRVLAPDLIGHGDSPWEPPWSIGAQLEALAGAVGDKPAVWIGHSYGGRIAFEMAARRPDLVVRLVLLDPAIFLPPHAALHSAESSIGDRSYTSLDEALDRRYEESSLHDAPRELVAAELEHRLVQHADGRWRYRYSQASVIAAYGEMATQPPPFENVRVPTLLLLGAESFLPYDFLVESHRAALGPLLTEVTVPGGHTLLWDALEPTGQAIRAFLDS